MNAVVDLARVGLYRKMKETENRIAALEEQIEITHELSKRGELKALRYALQMKLVALLANLQHRD